MSQITSHLDTHANFSVWFELATVTAMMSHTLPSEVLTAAVSSTRELVSELQSHDSDPAYSWNGSDPEYAQRECEQHMVEIANSFVEAAEADLADRNARVAYSVDLSETDIDAFILSILSESDEREPAEDDDDYL